MNQFPAVGASAPPESPVIVLPTVVPPATVKVIFGVEKPKVTLESGEVSEPTIIWVPPAFTAVVPIQS